MEVEEESLSVRNFVASRIQEVKSLTSQIAVTAIPESKGLAFQHVPKHMRRRAVSHNPKRLPKRLQEKHLKQVVKSSGAVIKKSKVPSRKYRRRKVNLLQEYNRRQREKSWLETHIWHAKRFHIKEKWKWKIPISPCDKGYRSLYRGFKSHCVMQDMSFYSFLQLSGSCILPEFEDKFPNSQVAYKMYENGQKEGKMLMYSGTSDQFIGQLRFISLNDCLLMWVHPCCKQEIIQEIISRFELYAVKSNATKKENKDDNANIDSQKLTPKELNCPNVYQNGTITLVDLEGAFNRIRLYGPKSTAILKNVLRPTVLNIRENTTNSTWWEDYYRNMPEILLTQSQLWESLKGEHEVPWSTVISLTVRDPRVFLPGQRKKPPIIHSTGSFEQNLKSYKVSSALWDKDIRNRVLAEKMPDSEFSKRRSELLIPGSELNLQWSENQVPVTVVYRSPGWDLIVPAGWAMAFWVALSYNCVRACGLRDAIHFALEEGSIHSEDLAPPDSISGISYSCLESEEQRSEYFRNPPAKRSNYIKLGCPFPFYIDWKIIISYWSKECSTSTVHVIRDQNILNTVEKYLKSKSVDTIPDEVLNCLIGVRVIIEGKGSIQSGAVICLPIETDLVEGEFDSEPMQEDHNELKRSELKKKHTKLMAFLRKKRKKYRNKDSLRFEEFESSKISENFNRSMEDLWLPDPKCCLQTMSRKPIGFVTLAGETYSMGKCSGLGFCTIQGIKEIAQKSTKIFVLLRNCRSTLEYRKATLHICKL